MNTSKIILSTTNQSLSFECKKAKQKKHSSIKRKERRRISKAAILAFTVTTAVASLPTGHGFSTLRNIRSIHPFDQSKSSVRTKSDVAYKSHDNSDEQQRQHDRATEKISTTTTTSPLASVRVQQQQQEQPEVHHVSNIFHTIWTSSKSRRALKQAEEYKGRKDQRVLDNYLESIDKRYKRLHKSKRQAVRNTTNDAWQWLMNGGTANKEDICAQEEQRKLEDGIYVLGLAELASKQLLQRHHLPVPQARERQRVVHDSAIVIDIEGSSLVREEDGGKQLSETVVASSTDLSLSEFDLARSPLSVMLSFSLFVKGLQTAYLARIEALSRKAFATLLIAGRATGISLAKTANFLTVNGGAKQTMQVATFAIMFVVTTASCALRPLTKA